MGILACQAFSLRSLLAAFRPLDPEERRQRVLGLPEVLLAVLGLAPSLLQELALLGPHL